MVRGPMVAMGVSFAGVVAGGLYFLTVLGKKIRDLENQRDALGWDKDVAVAERDDLKKKTAAHEEVSKICSALPRIAHFPNYQTPV